MIWLYLVLSALWLFGWIGTCQRYQIMGQSDWLSQGAFLFFTWPVMILTLGVR